MDQFQTPDSGAQERPRADQEVQGGAPQSLQINSKSVCTNNLTTTIYIHLTQLTDQGG